MTELVNFVFSVGGLVIFALLGVLGVSVRPQSARARRFLVAVMVFYALATIYATSFGIRRLYVAGFRPLTAADVPPGPTAVAVLGSGNYTIRDWSDGQFSMTDGIGASRVLEAVRVYNLVNPDWMITSGGKRRTGDFGQAAGISMRNLLVQLGVPADRVVANTAPLDTHQESLAVASMLSQLKVEHLVLVTSEVHMRRSVGAFRSAGVRVIPAIVREPFPPRSWQWIVPGEEGLWAANLLAHEILGLGYYAARGWYRF